MSDGTREQEDVHVPVVTVEKVEVVHAFLEQFVERIMEHSMDSCAAGHRTND